MQKVAKWAGALGLICASGYAGWALMDWVREKGIAREKEAQAQLASPPCQTAVQQFAQLATAYAETMIPESGDNFSRQAARHGVEAGIAEVERHCGRTPGQIAQRNRKRLSL